MQKRISHVDFVNVTDVSTSSILQVGDSYRITPRSRALAVQRQIEFFYGDEGNFDVYPIFQIDIPKPVVTEPIRITRTNENPFIRVNNIKLIGAAASSVVHIGSNSMIDAETRVKHIRQFVGDPYQMRNAQGDQA
ncbi:spore germination protein GerPE [Alkalihalobacillus sp. BA299]|uniref:spore germination protein GerPE n=1 Tax=Alkalihalobacillus sp. BA299 TaxID=2815938 RepID=UPI001ADB679B|nr:spore germination protein GerPE [Alkalihalobacillus sp. BA299]